MVALSCDDVTSGHGRPLAVEIAISPQWKIQKAVIATKWRLLD
jgi:hypothetical protein